MELTAEQEQVVANILSSPGSVFLGGSAGTGKSFVLRSLMRKFHKQKICCLATASTGIAAQNIQGSTLARTLGLGRAQSIREIGEVQIERAERNLQDVEVIIVEEVSMLSKSYIGLVDEVMRVACSTEEPFGGIKMIFCGDFLQLPPVAKDGPIEWAFEHPTFQELSMFVLRQQMRQTDPVSPLILDQIRRGRMEYYIGSLFEAMVRPPTEDSLFVLPRVAEVKLINEQKLAQLPGESQHYPADIRPASKMEALLRLAPVPASLDLKVGAPVICVANDSRGRFQNGSTGKVISLGREGVTVRFPKGEHHIQYQRFEILTPGDLVPFGTVDALPLLPAWAITIHRAQGLTLDNIHTDIASCWEPGHAYVALSRARSLRQISLRSVPREIRVDPVALAFTESLEKHCA